MKPAGLRSIDTNRVILLTLLLVGSWAFVTAFKFPARDRIYPQLASLIVVVGAMLLLAAEFLPEYFGRFGGATEDIFGTEELEVDVDEDEVDEMKRYKLLVSMAVYLIAGYLLGLLWATPIFVFLYTAWTKQSTIVIVLLTGMSFGIAYVFMVTLNLSIASGELIKGIANVI